MDEYDHYQMDLKQKIDNDLISLKNSFLCKTNLIKFKRKISDYLYDKIEHKEATYQILIKDLFNESNNVKTK